jgi:uncharacterized protein YrrD
MHVRFSIVRGTPVVDEQTQQTLGAIVGILPHPDTGDVLGFFVRGMGPLEGQELFLASADILSWGTKVHVKSEDRLAPPHDLIRIAALLEHPRPILGQKIVTQRARRTLGTCSDVQFDTRHFQIEWLFPKKFFMEGRPVPANDIVEVTRKSVIVKEPLKPRRVLADELAEAPAKILNEVVPATPSTRAAH